MELILYSQPVDNAIPTITHDNGVIVVGEEGYDQAGNRCLVVKLPPDFTIGHGVTVEWAHPDYVIEPQHCKIIQETGGKCWLLHDIWRMSQLITEQPEPQPPHIPGGHPFDVIQYVNESTKPNLSTHDGCGKFTSDCQYALSTALSALYGHIAKEPGQNQYDGHAVDAVMLLMEFGDIPAGVYDIITNSVSPDAKPAFNWVGPPDSNLWYNPAFDAFTLRARKK